MSFGNGRFYLIFKEVKDFMVALASSYLGEVIKRCWALVSNQDNLVVIQPSVSTPGLNVLILETEGLKEEEIKKIKEVLEKEKIAIIIADYLRRPSQSQGFTVGFNDIDNFVGALKTFYLSGKQERCRAIIPKDGPLVIQPSVSTPELNTLILENFNFMEGKEKGRIETIISSLEIIKCDVLLNSTKTTNF